MTTAGIVHLGNFLPITVTVKRMPTVCLLDRKTIRQVVIRITVVLGKLALVLSVISFGVIDNAPPWFR